MLSKRIKETERILKEDLKKNNLFNEQKVSLKNQLEIMKSLQKLKLKKKNKLL